MCHPLIAAFFCKVWWDDEMQTDVRRNGLESNKTISSDIPTSGEGGGEEHAANDLNVE